MCFLKYYITVKCEIMYAVFNKNGDNISKCRVNACIHSKEM